MWSCALPVGVVVIVIAGVITALCTAATIVASLPGGTNVPPSGVRDVARGVAYTGLALERLCLADTCVSVPNALTVLPGRSGHIKTRIVIATRLAPVTNVAVKIRNYTATIMAGKQEVWGVLLGLGAIEALWK